MNGPLPWFRPGDQFARPVARLPDVDAIVAIEGEHGAVDYHGVENLRSRLLQLELAGLAGPWVEDDLAGIPAATYEQLLPNWDDVVHVECAVAWLVGDQDIPSFAGGRVRFDDPATVAFDQSDPSIPLGIEVQPAHPVCFDADRSRASFHAQLSTGNLLTGLGDWLPAHPIAANENRDGSGHKGLSNRSQDPAPVPIMRGRTWS